MPFFCFFFPFSIPISHIPCIRMGSKMFIFGGMREVGSEEGVKAGGFSGKVYYI